MGTFLNFPIKEFINQYYYYKNNNKNIIDYKINEIFLKTINNKFNLNFKNINLINYSPIKKYIENNVINEMKELSLLYKNKISSQILNLIFHKKITEQMETNICYIKTNHTKGTGFFCKIAFPDEDNKLKVLITTTIILYNEILYNSQENIEISINCQKKFKLLNLNNRKKYFSEKYYITIIEIKEEDGINNYLELDDKIINDIINNENKIEKYEEYSIYTIFYLLGGLELQIVYGMLTNISKDRFIHNCQTGGYTTGSPILNINNKVIGVNLHLLDNRKDNFFSKGVFLNYPIKEFIEIKFNNIKKNHLISQENFDDKFSLIKKNFGSKIFKELNTLLFNYII